MMKVISYFVLLLILLLCSACAERDAAETGSTDATVPPTETAVSESQGASSPTAAVSAAGLVETADFRGVIFTAEQIAASPYWPGNDEPWTPAENDVLVLEAQLPGYLQEMYPDLGEKLDSYTRQYWGTVTESGNLAVYANFFCDAQGIASWLDWQTTRVEVEDGGDCYFQTLYDLHDGVFVWLTINGEA